MEKLMSAQDLSEVLGVPVATLYVWRHRQQGPPSMRVGRHLRYRASEVERWLDKRTAAA